jgi:hypothetical protein
MSPLPGILGEIERVTTRATAERLAMHAGGTEMKFSDRPTGSLARVVGLDAARRIVAELGREKYLIPMAHLRGQKGRRAAAAALLASGKSTPQTAKAVDVHERTVWRIKEKMREAPDLPLFPEVDRNGRG